MDIRLMYNLHKNEDAKRWEFAPKGDYTGYLVSFNEADNETDAWIAVYLSIKAEVKRKAESSIS